MRKTILLNGTDYTDAFTPTGYSVSYKKIRGDNSGYMLDGSYTDDVIAVKAIITCICMPTDEETLAGLLALLAETYLDVRFFDPRLNEYRTATMMPSDPEQKFRGTGTNAIDYWTGTVVTLTEK